MSEAEPTAEEAVREAVAQALENVRETKAHYLALRNGRDAPQTAAGAAELDKATRAVVAAEKRLAEARPALPASFDARTFPRQGSPDSGGPIRGSAADGRAPVCGREPIRSRNVS